MYFPNTPLWWSKVCAQCELSKNSDIFCFGNTHPLTEILYLLWGSMKVLEKKKRKEGSKGGREGYMLA